MRNFYKLTYYTNKNVVQHEDSLHAEVFTVDREHLIHTDTSSIFFNQIPKEELRAKDEGGYAQFRQDKNNMNSQFTAHIITTNR